MSVGAAAGRYSLSQTSTAPRSTSTWTMPLGGQSTTGLTPSLPRLQVYRYSTSVCTLTFTTRVIVSFKCHISNVCFFTSRHPTPPGICIRMHRYWLETWRRPFAPMHCTIPSGDVMMRCRRDLIGTRRLPMSASTPSDQNWWSQHTYSTR